jgi:hypothetical protein
MVASSPRHAPNSRHTISLTDTTYILLSLAR